MEKDELHDALQDFIARQGHPGRLAGPVLTIPEGHAGLAHSFALRMTDGTIEDYVLKLAPAGVRRSGSTDIYRQYPLLKLLKAHGLPVPDVPWASAADDHLGAPFIVMQRLPGKSLIIWEASPDDEGLGDYWLEAARLLARFHLAIEAQALAVWEQPAGLRDELDRWQRLIRHSPSEPDRAAAQKLAGDLAETIPAHCDIGLVHGDFQPGNILYVDRRATALIDWDLAAVGAKMVDLGWLLMMADSSAWAADWQPKGAPDADCIIKAYRAAGGSVANDIDWYRAFACFRMGVITGMNVKLHREGRRHDPIWEKFASSAATLLARGAILAEGKRGEPK